MRLYKSKQKRVVALSWFMLLSLSCYQLPAQDKGYFDHITTEEGLSQNDVNCIYQDKRGFMWFGTHDGLNKYDGYRFTIFKPDANKPGSISSNLIYSIDGDSDGNLWIGTTGSGLSRFDSHLEQFTNYKYQADNPKSLSNDYILVVYADSRNRLWIGTNDGLNRLDLNNGNGKEEFERIYPGHQSGHGPDGNIIHTVFEDSRDRLWVGTQAGLYRLKVSESGRVAVAFAGSEEGLGDVAVRDIAENKYGGLIMASQDGLHYQVKPGGSYINLSGIIHLDVQLDDAGNIWSATNQGLLQYAATGTDTIPRLENSYAIDLSNPRSLNKNVIRSLFRDNTGIIWIGTNGGGVNRFDPQRKQFRHFSNTLSPGSLSYNKIRAIFEDSNGTIWIGTEGGGLNMQTATGNDGGVYNNFENFDIITKPFAITEINRGGTKTLLIGAENTPSLYKLDISNPEKIAAADFLPITTIANGVFTILEDHQNNVWVGTYKGGLYKWAFRTGREEHLHGHFTHNPADPHSISNDIIRNIYEDSEGNLWFGTGAGLSKLSREEVAKNNPRFTTYKNIPGDTNSLSHNYILTIYQSKPGDLWIGTFGGGLNRYVKGAQGEADRFISYSEADGLPNNVIKGILEDDRGYLWLSTNKGLSRFDPQQLTFKNYDVNDGLQSNEFQELACYKRKDGEMLFGGINGFNAFYPEAITDNPFAAETVIANFLILNKPVKTGEYVNGRILLEAPVLSTSEIKLKYKENSFSFEFAALHFSAPGKNKFAYKLEGFNKDWIYTSADHRFATYTNLAPGNYVFHVKASNNDGVWDRSPAKLNITIIPPWWRTRMAYFLYGLLILGLLMAFRRYTIIRTTEKHQLMLEHMEKEKSEELQRMKLEFFTNISHEIRTPLTLIKGPLEYLLKNNASLGRKERKQQYALMRRNTNYLMRLVNQLMDFRKIDRGKMKLYLSQSDIVNFVKDTTGPFHFLAGKKNISYTFSAPDQPVEAWFDPDALEKILNNLLTNAFKFTPENGAIGVEIHHDHNWVAIRIRDNGCGIPDDKIAHIFDRFYVEKEKHKTNRQGVGIGLSFTKSLVELHQGKIQVDSQVGHGTTFTVSFPTNKNAYKPGDVIQYLDQPASGKMRVARETGWMVEEALPEKSLPESRQNLPVLLIIDDHADIRTFIRQGFAGKYQIFEAGNGVEGLELLDSVVPNIIICDIMMPVMDGIAFCARVRDNKSTSHIPLILLTAKITAESELEGLKTGADDYLKKPFDLEVLQVKIKKILDYREQLRKRFRLEMTMEPGEVAVTSADEKISQTGHGYCAGSHDGY